LLWLSAFFFQKKAELFTLQLPLKGKKTPKLAIILNNLLLKEDYGKIIKKWYNKIMEKLKTAGIIGYGQIGKTIAKFYNSPKIKDLNRNDNLKGVDVLNICIPYSEDFIKIVKKEIAEIKPKLTIIHSTVEPGTTKKIGGMVVHSPIRGVHPNLYEGIKKMVKYIGADILEAGIMAEEHIRNLGIEPKAFGPSIITEMGKLLDTTYYGLCIAWHGEAKKICDKFKIPFEQAMTHFNETYNEGYIKLGKKNVVRPVLYPPKDNIIGRHCIIPNAKILKKHFNSEALDLILKYNKNG